MSMKISTVITGGIALLALIFSIVAINVDVPEMVKNLGGVTNYDIVDVSDGYRVDGTTIIDGSGNVSVPAVTVAGQVINTPDTITATTTLTIDSSPVQFLPASANMTTITLPAVTTGASFTFQVTGALTGSSVLIDSAEGDNIDGTLIVAGAVVDCRGEDQINIITDGEAIGDYVEIWSDGTQWFLKDSGVLTAGKMTCTDPS